MDLISTQTRVELPFVIVKIGDYTFGNASRKGQMSRFGGSVEVTFPSYMQSINITKINGLVNTYSIRMVYPIAAGDDPNKLEKVFSSVYKNRKILISYGDWNQPTNIFREESAIITDVKQNINFSGSTIDYTISAVSDLLSLTASLYDFPARTLKGSDVIKDVVYNQRYGMTNVLTGMQNKTLVNSTGLIASDDLVIDIPAMKNISTLDYVNYVAQSQCSVEDHNKPVIRSSIYLMSIFDDINNIYGGPYLKVTKILKDLKPDPLSAYSVDVGYPGNNFVTLFSIDNSDNWSILYDYLSREDQPSYKYSIDNSGKLVTEFSPSILRLNRLNKVTPLDLLWWTKMTEFPITLSITIKGLIRPSILMDYVRLNVLFYGQKHTSSGLYVITKQVDTVDGNGFKTTLSLLRVGGDL